MQEIQNGDYYLISSYGYFYAPDGEQYRAAWGPVELIKAEDLLGFNPTRSTNWLLKIGTGEGAVIISGCQINYFVKCTNKPKMKEGTYTDQATGMVHAANSIYITI